MSKTRRDIIDHAALEIGLGRQGQSLGGNVFNHFDSALSALLLELDDECELDWDVSVDGEIPDERSRILTQVFMYATPLDRYDRRRTPADRELLYERHKRRLFAAVIGDTDFVEEPPRNF